MGLYRSTSTILKLVTNGAGIRPAIQVERLIRLQRKRNPFDPGNTERIRKRYAREMHTRFARMRSLVRQSLIENEALSPVTLRIHAAGKPAKPGQLSGPADIAVAAFQAWLQKTSAEVVLGVEGEWPPPEDQPRRQWQRVISGQAYLAGLEQAAAQGAALGLPDIPAARALFQLPRHTVAADVISGRQYQLLVGVSEKMADDLRTILGDGMRNGLSVDELVDSLTSRISKLERTRALAIAQTEVTFAQNEALLNAMEDLGVQTVTALVEFATTSGNPCPFCEDLEGQVFSIDEARGVIPVHPSCACLWLPVPVQERRKAA